MPLWTRGRRSDYPVGRGSSLGGIEPAGRKPPLAEIAHWRQRSFAAIDRAGRSDLAEEKH